jgi:uncharacterized protein YndB with AHSA1/START domain
MPIPSEPIELDLRIGGVWRQQMVIDESTAYVTGGVYCEIVPDERLVFTWGATDGWPRLDADRLDDGPLVTVVFGQVDGRTELTVHVELPAHLSDEGVQEWWSLAFAPAGATRSCLGRRWVAGGSACRGSSS